MTASPPPPVPSSAATAAAPGFRINLRVVLLLALLTGGICGLVLLADRLSRRDRAAGRDAAPATHASTEHRREADATAKAGSDAQRDAGATATKGGSK